MATFLTVLPGAVQADSGLETILAYKSTGWHHEQESTGGGPSEFYSTSFDDSLWAVDSADFGNVGCRESPATYWRPSTDLLLRHAVDLGSSFARVEVHVKIDNSAQVYINGFELTHGMTVSRGCWSDTGVLTFAVPDSLIHNGTNLVAVRARDNGGASYFDLEVTGSHQVVAGAVDQEQNGQFVVYVDNNGNGSRDPDEPSVASPVKGFVAPKAEPQPDGSVLVYNDSNGDGRHEPNEPSVLAPAPPANPKTESEPDGSTLVYNDANHNGQSDRGEALATVPGAPNPAIRGNVDDGFTVYDDRDGNGEQDAGDETIALATVPRAPNPAIRGNVDDGFTVYDDRDGNGEQDAGDETIALIAGTAGDASLPGEGASLSVQAESTPDVPSQTVSTPAVVAPKTCQVSACDAPTVVSGTSVTTPPVPPTTVTTPAVPVGQTCVPLVICVGPFTVPSQTVGPTPGFGPQTVTVPSQTLPALCSVAGAVCLPATTVLGSQSASTPHQGPIGLTPAITVAVSLAPSSASFHPHLGQLGSIGPFTTTVPVPIIGNVPVTLCPQTCPVPVPADVSYHGSVTVRVVVGPDVHEATIPVDVG